MNFLDKVFDFLASLKLAVVTLIALAVSLAAATFVESAYGTPVAKHYFYQAPWFTFILLVLGVNVLCAALSRWPWKPRHWGFVVTHAGIIVLLIGALITQQKGMEGTLMLDTNEKASAFDLLEDQVTVYSSRTNMTAAFPANGFKFHPPTPAHPIHYNVPNNGPQLAVMDYLDSSVRKTGYQPGGPKDPSAVEFQIKNAMVQQDQWLGTDSAEHSEIDFGPASFKLVQTNSPAEFKQAMAPQTGSAYQGELELTFPQGKATFPVAGKVGEYQGIPNTAYKLRVLDYLPNAVVAPDKKKLISKGDEAINPAIDFEILTVKGVEDHTVLARFPNESGLHKGTDMHLDVKAVYHFDPDKAAATQLGNRVVMVVDPQGRLHVNLHARDGRNQTGDLTPGEPYDTGWMGMQLTVKQFLPHAATVDQVVAGELPRGGMGGDSGLPPALHLMAALGGQTKDFWIRRGEGFALMIGGDNLEIDYGRKTKPMGFQLQLNKFHVERDPGSTSPAAYQSDVTLNDPGQGVVDQKSTISMNEPLHHRGWTFFQSSFSEVNGEPRISIFTVAYDPGVPVKYAGSLIMCFGIAMMFWMRGWYQGLGKTKRTVTRPASKPDKGEASAAGRNGADQAATEEKEAVLSGGRKGRK